MLYFVCSYPENSQEIIGLKYLYVSLILSIRRKFLSNKIVLHQILNKIYNFFLIFTKKNGGEIQDGRHLYKVKQ